MVCDCNTVWSVVLILYGYVAAYCKVSDIDSVWVCDCIVAGSAPHTPPSPHAPRGWKLRASNAFRCIGGCVPQTPHVAVMLHGL